MNLRLRIIAIASLLLAGVLVGALFIWWDHPQRRTSDEDRLLQIVQDEREDTKTRLLAAEQLILHPHSSALPVFIAILSAPHDCELDYDDFIPNSDAEKSLKAQAARGLTALNGGGPEAVPVLRDALKDQNLRTRLWACRALGWNGRDAAVAAPDLRRRLASDIVPSVRVSAGEALELIQPDQTVQLASEVVLDEAQMSEVHEWGARTLGLTRTHKDEAVSVLRKAIKNSNRRIRASAALNLGYLSPDARIATADLVDALRDEDERTRSFAAFSIGQIGMGGTDVCGGLISALSDPSSQVRKDAATALSHVSTVGNKTVMDALTKATKDSDPAVRENAKRQLDMMVHKGVEDAK